MIHVGRYEDVCSSPILDLVLSAWDPSKLKITCSPLAFSYILPSSPNAPVSEAAQKTVSSPGSSAETPAEASMSDAIMMSENELNLSMLITILRCVLT